MPSLPEKDTVIPPLHIEPAGGLYKWDGLYHTSGQNAIPAERPYHGRVSRTSISGDFKNWSQASAIQSVRVHQHELLGPGQEPDRASKLTRATVSGIAATCCWVSPASGTAPPEWKDLTIDLGFVLSNDGVHFREAMAEWTFLERGKDGEWDQGGLLQGQGFENVGDETWIYYGAWDPRNWESSPPRGGVGIAVLPRDRFRRTGRRRVDAGPRRLPDEGNGGQLSDFIDRSRRGWRGSFSSMPTGWVRKRG